MKKLFLLAMMALTLCLGGWRSRKETVKIICPYGVGGTADAISRKFAQVANELYGDEYNFIVEQKTGGDGFAAAAYFQNVNKKKKELLVYGYGNVYRHDIGKEFGTEQVPWDKSKITPVASIDDRTWILYAKPGTTLEDVVAKSREADGILLSGGNPLSDPHLALGSLLALEGGEATVVAYNGGAAQKQGLLNNEVDVFVGTTQAGMEEVEAGTLIPILAFSKEGYNGFIGTTGSKIKVPGIGANKPSALAADKDHTGSILPAGGFLAARVGTDEEWISKVTEISKAVWNSEEYNGWIDSIGLNRFEVYDDEAESFLDSAVSKAINAYKLLSGTN